MHLEELNIFYWFGRSADTNWFSTLLLLSLLTLFGAGVVIALLVIAFQKKSWRTGAAGAGTLLVVLYFSLMLVNARTAWLAGLCSTLLNEDLHRFETDQLKGLAEKLPEDAWHSTDQELIFSLSKLAIKSQKPSMVSWFKSSEGWFFLDLVYGGRRGFWWGIYFSSNGNFRGLFADKTRTVQRIAPNAMAYISSDG